MIIGLTPFLYLHDTMKIPGLQDGISDKIILQFLDNWEKSQLPRKFLLTLILRYAMIIVLGRLGDRPFLLYDADPEVVLCAADSMSPKIAKSPCSEK